MLQSYFPLTVHVSVINKDGLNLNSIHHFLVGVPEMTTLKSTKPSIPGASRAYRDGPVKFSVFIFKPNVPGQARRVTSGIFKNYGS